MPRAPRSFACLGALLALAGLVLGGCQTADPVKVQPAFTATPALYQLRPAAIAVLPLEDATADRRATEYLPFLRQELNRQLIDRRYSSLAQGYVDAALKGQADRGALAGRSLMEPAVLKRFAGQCAEEALLAVRIDAWEDSMILSTKRLIFRCHALLLASDGQVLWSGSLGGEIKAGGAGAAPLDRDGMARSCGEILVRELLQQLPERQP
jgi:hypothetical protein